MPVSCGPRQGGEKGPHSGAKSLTPDIQGMSRGSLEGSILSPMDHSVKVRLMNPGNNWWLQPSSEASFRLSLRGEDLVAWKPGLAPHPTPPQEQGPAVQQQSLLDLVVSGLFPWADKARRRLGWALETSGARQKAMAFIPLGGGSQHGWPRRAGTGPELSLPMQTQAVGA